MPFDPGATGPSVGNGACFGGTNGGFTGGGGTGKSTSEDLRTGGALSAAFAGDFASFAGVGSALPVGFVVAAALSPPLLAAGAGFFATDGAAAGFFFAGSDVFGTAAVCFSVSDFPAVPGLDAAAEGFFDAALAAASGFFFAAGLAVLATLVFGAFAAGCFASPEDLAGVGVDFADMSRGLSMLLG